MRTAIALALLACACVPGNGPLMLPGENCQGCHGNAGQLFEGERRRHAKEWTVAGTVFDAADPQLGSEGAQVRIIDANGRSFSLRTNLAGNFYSREVCQQEPVMSGACNSCHNLPAFNAPQPPLTAP